MCRDGSGTVTMRTLGITIVVLLASAVFGGTARADVPLSSEARSRLEASIQSAHARDAATFDAVRGVVAQADALDHQKRGRFYPMTSLLRSVVRGHSGSAMALLEPLVAPQRFTMPSSESARIALFAGLLEAAGDSKDPAAAPVYRAIIANETEFYELRAAVEALGKLGNDADVAMLSSLAQTRGPKQDAVIAGMGDCRRVAAARALEAVVAQNPTGMSAKHLARALSAMGSAWALATPNAAPALEAPAIRDTTARAALAMWMSNAEARTDASNALVVIAAPDAPTWIAGAKRGASPDLAAALDALAARLAHNPTMTGRL
jgi:hypothetical protein